MKKLIAFFLVLWTLMILSSCSDNQNLPTTSIRFYYKTVSVNHGSETGVITWEDREISIAISEPASILSLYLNGSQKKGCVMPFPSGTSIREYDQTASKATILLSAEATLLSGAEFTLASVCLARTTIELTGCQSVQISVNDANENQVHNITVIPDNFTLFDYWENS